MISVLALFTAATAFSLRIAASGAGVVSIVWWAMLIMGIGWGCTEAAINPVTAVLYPDDKIHRMNILHAWWPAGIVVGGLTSLLIIQVLNLDWRVAGALAHRISDNGLLWISTIPAGVGLYLLSIAHSPLTALVAATVWAIGVCYMWPTMLAAVAHRFRVVVHGPSV